MESLKDLRIIKLKNSHQLFISIVIPRSLCFILLLFLIVHQNAYANLPEGTRGYEIIPGVIRNDGVDSFRLFVDTNGPVNRVYFDKAPFWFTALNSLSLELRDDGLEGDQFAGDYIFTSQAFVYNSIMGAGIVDPSGLSSLAVLSISPVTIEETDGTTSSFLGDIEIGILRSDIPETKVNIHSTDIATASHLININTEFKATQLSLRSLREEDISAITKRIYTFLPDVFDMFIFFSSNKIQHKSRLDYSNFISGNHHRVQINYLGTGSNLQDRSNFYGSEGKLLSINNLDTVGRGTNSNNAVHEILHQWGANIDQSLGLTYGSHYLPRSSIGSFLGGFRWIKNSDGTHTLDCEENRGQGVRAAPLDKYMMGLIDESQVPEMHVYSDDTPRPGFRCGEVINDIVKTVTIEDIQSKHGVRWPSPSEAQRDFSIGFVVESHKRMLTLTEMTFYNKLASHFTKAIPANAPDPIIGYSHWVPIGRYFGEETTWRSGLPNFNRAPLANGLTINLDENSTYTGILSGSDPDNDMVSYRIFSNALNGNITITDRVTGTFTYEPNTDTNGSDYFTFMVSDGLVSSVSATVQVTVNATNNSPVIIGVPNTTVEEDTVDIKIKQNNTTPNNSGSGGGIFSIFILLLLIITKITKSKARNLKAPR